MQIDDFVSILFILAPSSKATRNKMRKYPNSPIGMTFSIGNLWH